MSLMTPEQLIASQGAATGPTATSRLRGGVLMVLGPVLAVSMAWALASLGPALLAGSATDPGTREQDLTIFAVLAIVGAFGALGTVAGWQLWRHGCFDRRVGLPLAVVVAVLLAAVPLLKRMF
ncbi:MAG: hypothetical protein JNM33_08845 [Rubrivivax sp.]|nr:hypothetical protein [Rubrivivax sp.]